MTLKSIRQVSNIYEALPGQHLDSCLDELRQLMDTLQVGQSIILRHNSSQYVVSRKVEF